VDEGWQFKSKDIVNRQVKIFLKFPQPEHPLGADLINGYDLPAAYWKDEMKTLFQILN
jgi:hypothetical protein